MNESWGIGTSKLIELSQPLWVMKIRMSPPIVPGTMPTRLSIRGVVGITDLGKQGMGTTKESLCRILVRSKIRIWVAINERPGLIVSESEETFAPSLKSVREATTLLRSSVCPSSSCN